MVGFLGVLAAVVIGNIVTTGVVVSLIGGAIASGTSAASKATKDVGRMAHHPNARVFGERLLIASDELLQEGLGHAHLPESRWLSPAGALCARGEAPSPSSIPDVSWEEDAPIGVSALWAAARGRHFGVASKLLKGNGRGVDPNKGLRMRIGISTPRITAASLEVSPLALAVAQGNTGLAQELLDSGADAQKGLTLRVGPLTYSESPFCFMMTSRAPGAPPALGEVASALVRAGGAGHQAVDCFGMSVRRRPALEVAESRGDEAAASLLDAAQGGGGASPRGALRSLRYRGGQYSSSLMRFLFAKEQGGGADGKPEAESGKSTEGMCFGKDGECEQSIDWFECYFVQGRGDGCPAPKGLRDEKDTNIRAFVNTSLSDRLYGGASLQEFVAARIVAEGAKGGGACGPDAPDGPLKELHAGF